jgi:Rhs element Vgr protein
VECKDAAVKMTVGRKSKYFYESTDSDILEEILGEYELDKDVEATTVTHPEMVQYYSTDWDFIVSRAEANGKLVFTEDGKVVVKKPDLSTDPALSLLWGGNVLEFAAEMDARDQFSAMKAKAWAAADQQIVETEAASFSDELPGNISSDDLAGVVSLSEYLLDHSGQVKDVELQQWVDSALVKSRISKIRGSMTIQGYPDVIPGSMVEIGGMGERFNGKVYVSAVRHEISSENWETNLQLGLSPNWFAKEVSDIIATKASGLVPAINGLQIGVVTALEGDPEGEYRVKVTIPIVSEDEEGIWARVALLDAGDSRGSFFRPEIGDEVVVGFLNDDPRNPVILGMMHSSAKPSPIEPADDNHEKGFITRSEMKLHFDDDKKIITIVTPNGNTIVMSDDEGGITVEDENGNKAVFDSSGINMESASDINIKATGDVNIEGNNVNIKANLQLKAEGSAQAELSSGGSTAVKGSIVQIN